LEKAVFIQPCFADDITETSWNIYLVRENGDFILSEDEDFIGLGYDRKNILSPAKNFNSYAVACEYILNAGDINVYEYHHKESWEISKKWPAELDGASIK